MPKADDELNSRPIYEGPAQIYKEKLSELLKQNQELTSQSEALCAEYNNLLSENKELTVQYSDLTARTQNLITLNEELKNALNAAKKAAKRRWIFPVLTVVALVLAAVCYAGMDHYSKLFEDEMERRTEVQAKYSVAQALQEETEMALESALTELVNMSAGAYGKSSSNNFYAEDSLAVLTVGQAETVRLHVPKYVYLGAFPSNEDALDVNLSNVDIINKGEADLEITAHQAGLYTINLQYSKNRPILQNAPGSGEPIRTGWTTLSIRKWALRQAIEGNQTLEMDTFNILVLVLEE